MKPALLLAMVLAPGTSLASAGGEALLAILGLQLGVFLWPILLPLFFIGNARNKRRAYVVFVVATFGVLGLVTLPVNFLNQFAYLLDLGQVQRFSFGLTIAVEIVAIGASIWLLKRFGGSAIAWLEQEHT